MKPQQASATAKVIAAAMILLDSREQTRHWVPRYAAQWSEIFLSASRSGRFLVATVKCPLTRALWRCVEKGTLPGIMKHYAHRKRWIEAQCRAAFAGGYGHLVVVGAGFDTLGLRMAEEFPEITVTEIDHPATQNEKLQGMEMHQKAWPQNMRFLPLDLTAQQIPTSACAARKPTIFVMEGLLMYLPEERVRQLFENLHAWPVGASRIIASYMCRRADGKASFTPRSRLIDLWLRQRHEPFCWSRTPEQMRKWLEEAGYFLRCHATGPEMAGGPSIEGENFLLAERAMNQACEAAAFPCG